VFTVAEMTFKRNSRSSAISSFETFVENRDVSYSTCICRPRLE